MTYALTQPTPASRERGLTLLQWVLYSLAVIVLVLGGWTAIGFINFAASLSGMLPMLQALSSPAVVNLLGPALRQSATTLGMVTFVLAAVLSALLFTAGKLLGRVHDLSQRVEQLEARLRLSSTSSTPA